VFALLSGGNQKWKHKKASAEQVRKASPAGHDTP